MIVQNVQGNNYNSHYKYSSRPINNTQNINFNGLGFLNKTKARFFDVFEYQQKDFSSNFSKSIFRIWEKIENHPSNMTPEKLESAINIVKKAHPGSSEKAILITMQRLTQWANYSCLEPLGKKLNDLHIGQVDHKENDLFHKILSYFIDKKGIIGTSIYNKFYSTYLTKNNLDSYQTQVGFNKYINLEGFEDGINIFTDDNQLATKTIKTIHNVKRIMSKEPHLMYDEALSKVLNNEIIEHAQKNNLDLLTIAIHKPATRETILEQMKPKLPESINQIEITINEFVKLLKPKTQKQSEILRCKIAKYFEDNLIFYTKQDLINSLERINTGIKNYAKTNNIDEQNIFYVIPRSENTTVKSYGVITEMYKRQFNIPNSRIKTSTFYESINEFPKNSAIVILDDAAISGQSLISAGDYIGRATDLTKDKHILFCPLISFQEGHRNIKEIIKKLNRENCDTIITANFIDAPVKFSLKNFLNNLYFKKNNLGKIAFDNYPVGRNANQKAIVLPYMSPDNNPALATVLTQLFIPCSETTGISAIKSNHRLLSELNKRVSKAKCE